MAKLLLVEDDPDIQMMYSQLFQFKKMECSTASDGTEGLKKAQSGLFDLILLDIMMPGMSGLDVLKQIKADPKIKDTPVIMLTNLSDDENINAAMSMGAISYFVKSQHDPHVIADLITQVLEEEKKK